MKTTQQKNTTANTSQNREPNLWQEIKHADTYGHSEYRSRLGLVAWWPKDGAWHVALPCPDLDPVTKLKTGGFRWTEIPFPNPESAMVAVERGIFSVPAPAKPAPVPLVADLTQEAPAGASHIKADKRAKPAHNKGEGRAKADAQTAGTHTPDFKKMALDVATAWDSEGAHTNVRLLKQIAAQLHAAYVLGETDADRRAGRVLDSIAAAPETAAERDRLREQIAQSADWQKQCIRLKSQLDLAREQVKTLLGACKDLVADASITSEPFPSAVVRQSKLKKLQAAIASVESEGQ